MRTDRRTRHWNAPRAPRAVRGPRRRRHPSRAYDPVWRRALHRAAETLALAGREHAEKHSRFAELIAQPPQRRRLLVDNSEGFRTWALADLILERSQSLEEQDPGTLEDLARLALRVAARLDPDRYGRQLIAALEARAWTLVGEARRQARDLAAAERGFRRAAACLETAWDAAETADYWRLLGRLRRDQGRIQEALLHFRWSARLFAELGESGRAAEALADGSLVLDRGEPGCGIIALGVSS